MIQSVRVMKRRYKTALSCVKKRDDGKLRKSDKKLKRIERSVFPFVRNGISVTVNAMACPAAVKVRRSLTASFASRSVEVFEVSIVKIFLALLSELEAEQGRLVPETEVWLSFRSLAT